MMDWIVNIGVGIATLVLTTIVVGVYGSLRGITKAQVFIDAARHARRTTVQRLYWELHLRMDYDDMEPQEQRVVMNLREIFWSKRGA